VTSYLKFPTIFLIWAAIFSVGYHSALFAEDGHYLSRPFQQSEFPNYFLSERYRNVPIDQIPPQEITRAKGRLEKALASVFRRLTLPMVPDGAQAAQNVRYFDYLGGKLGAIDANAKLLASGGVVRSGISYIYEQLNEGAGKKPPVSANVVLQNIIKATEDLPGYHVRGVGSDFDALLIAEKNSSALKQEVLRLTNSAETKYEMTQRPGDLKRSLFAVGDVKNYAEQIARSTRQGGATIDFLAFDVQNEKFIEPERYPHIVEDLLRGVYAYLPPVADEAIEDGAKQAVRGGRALLELPFLRLKDEKQLRSELNALLDQIKEGKPPSQKSLDQFAKMVRNAREAGAHNRFYRAPPGSIESLFLEVAQKLKPATSKPLIPEFVDRFTIENRTSAKGELHGISSRLLMPMNEFIEKHTAKGQLYHGTPSTENGIAIIRGGLFLSKSDQGTAAYGRGAYTSSDLRTSQGYAGSSGIVFPLEVKQDARINILDWQTVKDKPEIQEIVRKAEKAGRDPFEYLAREHGIDIIINTHVLLQNQEAIRVPTTKTLVDSFANAAKNPHLEGAARLSALGDYRQLYQYAFALGESRLEDPNKLESAVTKEIKSALLKELKDSKLSPEKRYHALKGLKEIETYFVNNKTLTEVDFAKRMSAYRGSLVRGLKDVLNHGNDLSLRFQAGVQLIDLDVKEESVAVPLAKLFHKQYELDSNGKPTSPFLSDSNGMERIHAIWALMGAKVKHPEIRKALAVALARDPNPSAAGQALSALVASGEKDSALLDAALERLSRSPKTQLSDTYVIYGELVAFEPAPEKVVPVVLRALEQPELDLWPAKALARHDPTNPLLVPYLLRILESDQNGWKTPSLEILARPEVPKTPEAKEFLRKYIASSKSQSGDKSLAAQALVGSGDRDRGLLLHVLSRWQNTSPENLDRIANLVTGFPFADNPEELERIIEIASGEEGTSSIALKLLKDWHEKSKTVEGTIRSQIANPGTRALYEKIRLLSQLGPRESDSIRVLENFLDPQVYYLTRTTAALALAQAGHSNAKTQEILSEYAHSAGANPGSLRYIGNQVDALIEHSGISNCGDLLKKLEQYRVSPK